MISPEFALTPCPDCNRLTTAVYCCRFCGPDAFLERHSESCDRRHADRTSDLKKGDRS